MPFLLLSALLLLSAPTQAKPPASDLLDKLAANEAQLQHLYEEGNYKVSTTFQNLDPSSGSVKSANEMETRMYRKDGKPWEEITKYLENGKDVTAARAAQREKEVREGKRKRSDGIPFKSPFASDEQKKYTFTDAGPNPADPTEELIAFEPHTATRDTQVGKAFIEAKSGIVHRMEFHPAIKPNFVHKLDVTMEYSSTPFGWAPTLLTVNGEGGLFFVKKRVHVETKIEAYEMPEPATAMGARRPGE